MQQTYVVYWREANRQLFGFRQNVTATSPRAARELFRSSGLGVHGCRDPYIVRPTISILDNAKFVCYSLDNANR